MKKFLVMLAAACFLLGGFAAADVPHASLTSVKHQKGERHRAHKATKHKAPKRSHRTV
jgi:hypothetical protein